MGKAVNDEGLDIIFRQARSQNAWQDTPISDTQTQLRRLKLFCAAYGHPEALEPTLHMAVRRLDDLIDFITSRAAVGDPAQLSVLQRGDVEIYRGDRAHIRDNLI